MRLIDRLEELEDLQNVSHSMDITDEIAEALDEDYSSPRPLGAFAGNPIDASGRLECLKERHRTGALRRPLAGMKPIPDRSVGMCPSAQRMMLGRKL